MDGKRSGAYYGWVALGVVMALVMASGVTAAAFPTPAIAANLIVCPSGCTFSSIQAAIGAAASGDTEFFLASNM